MVLFTVCKGEYQDVTDWASYSEDIICQEVHVDEKSAMELLDDVVGNLKMERRPGRFVKARPGTEIIIYVEREVSCF